MGELSKTNNSIKLVFYISDHGFGHAARCIPIITALVERCVEVHVVCGEKHAKFIKANTSGVASYRTEHTDVGFILQHGTLLVDKEMTERAVRDYLAKLQSRAVAEARWLKDNNIDIAASDMPLWSFEACRMANVPLMFLGNFTWVEQYQEHLSIDVCEAYAAEYRKIRHATLYQLYNEQIKSLLANADVEYASLTCRPFAEKVIKIKEEMGGRKKVFIALGMSASFIEKINVSGLPYTFIVNDSIQLIGENVVRLPANTENTQDYIKASDYVIIKAGWGSVAETLLAGKRLALFERDTVLEDRNTIEQLTWENHAIKIKQENLYNIPAILEKMDTLESVNTEKYYESASMIADRILTLRR